ncbi:hypothetical protein D3C72_2297260 [compost metagenome]
MPQGEGSQQREANHHAEGHDEKGCHIIARRAFLPEHKKQSERQKAGYAGAGEGQEHWIETRYRNPRGGQRAAEYHHADKAP